MEEGWSEGGMHGGCRERGGALPSPGADFEAGGTRQWGRPHRIPLVPRHPPAAWPPRDPADKETSVRSQTRAEGIQEEPPRLHRKKKINPTAERIYKSLHRSTPARNTLAFLLPGVGVSAELRCLGGEAVAAAEVRRDAPEHLTAG